VLNSILYVQPIFIRYPNNILLRGYFFDVQQVQISNAMIINPCFQMFNNNITQHMFTTATSSTDYWVKQSETSAQTTNIWNFSIVFCNYCLHTSCECLTVQCSKFKLNCKYLQNFTNHYRPLGTEYTETTIFRHPATLT